jgi:hypothetical protein
MISDRYYFFFLGRHSGMCWVKSHLTHQRTTGPGRPSADQGPRERAARPGLGTRWWRTGTSAAAGRLSQPAECRPARDLRPGVRGGGGGDGGGWRADVGG